MTYEISDRRVHRAASVGPATEYVSSGAALHRKLDPHKDMKDVVDVIRSRSRGRGTNMDGSGSRTRQRRWGQRCRRAGNSGSR